MELSHLYQHPQVSSLFYRKISSFQLANFKTNQLHLPSFNARLPNAARRFSRIYRNYSTRAAAAEPPAKALRRLLESPGILQAPVCHDALSAKLVERAGFPMTFMGGFALSAARLGLPDVGLISYGEVLDQGLQITQAVSIPVIGDGDNGYGNHMNVKRTVKGFIRAGFAGILLEDQVSPKACGHTAGRKVISREDAVMKIRAAIDARNEIGSDFVIIARTDSRQAVSFEEALWRSRAFANAGADALFIDALASREEMEIFCKELPLHPKMANMLEGGGKTPTLSPSELQEIGFKFVAYPLSLIGVSIRAMENALITLKDGHLPSSGTLPSFGQIKEIVGFNEYYEEEERYKTNGTLPFTLEEESFQEGKSDQNAKRTSDPIVEAISPSSDDSFNHLFGILSKSLRLEVEENNGKQKLNCRIPAWFLDRMSCFIPGISGVNFKELLEKDPLKNASENGNLLIEFEGAVGDKIKIFAE